MVYTPKSKLFTEMNVCIISTRLLPGFTICLCNVSVFTAMEIAISETGSKIRGREVVNSSFMMAHSMM